MFILVPYRTTTVLYHFPWVTIGLIVVNVVVHLATPDVGFPVDLPISGAKQHSGGLLLTHGDGLHPIQWLTSAFLHADLGHLVGNMIFLWVFGQIVEGRLGWCLYLAVYLFVAIGQSFVEQVLMLGSDGGASLGASSAIFGLVAMTLVWAPTGRVHLWYLFVFLLFVRVGTFWVRTRTVAIAYIAWDAVGALLAYSVGVALTSATLHIMGAAIALLPAVVLLRMGLVESGEDDALPLGAERREAVGAHGARDDRSGAPAELDAYDGFQETDAETRATALSLLGQYLDEGDAVLAKMVYDDCVAATGPWELPEPALRRLIRGLRGKAPSHEVRPLLDEYVARFPDLARAARERRRARR